MTTRTKLILATVAVVVIASIAVCATYLIMSAKHREDIATLVQQSAEKRVAELKAASDAAADRMVKRDEEWLKKQKELERRLAEIKTPEQAAEQLQHRGYTFTPIEAPTLPNAASSVRRPVEFRIDASQLVPLNAQLTRCDEREDALNHCEADKQDLTTQRDNAEETARQWQTTSNQWEKAAKGGSKLRRVYTTSIKVAVGIGIGYALAKAK